MIENVVHTILWLPVSSTVVNDSDRHLADRIITWYNVIDFYSEKHKQLK